MTTQELKETIFKLKGYVVISVDFEVNTFTDNKGCVYAFDLTKKGLLKANSVKFLWTVSDYQNCNY